MSMWIVATATFWVGFWLAWIIRPRVLLRQMKAYLARLEAEDASRGDPQGDGHG